MELKGLYETLPFNSVCFVVLLNFQTVFSPVALLSAAHEGVCTFGVMANLKGLLKGLFELYPNFVFLGTGGEYPFWKLALQN